MLGTARARIITPQLHKKATWKGFQWAPIKADATLLRLDGFQIGSQIGDALCHLLLVALVDRLEENSPNGHFRRAVVWRGNAVAKDAGDVGVRKLSVVSPGERGEIGRRFSEGRIRRRRPVAFAVVAMTYSAILLVENGASRDRSCFLLLRGRLLSRARTGEKRRNNAKAGCANCRSAVWRNRKDVVFHVHADGSAIEPGCQ